MCEFISGLSILFFDLCILFSASTEMIMWFLVVVDVVYHIDWFACVEPSLWPWDESNLVVVYHLFYMLLDSVCQYFVENFCAHLHQRYWPVVFFFGSISVWFWYQGDGGFIECLWEYSLLFSLLEEFEKDQYKFFFVCLVEFSSETIRSWTFVCRSIGADPLESGTRTAVVLYLDPLWDLWKQPRPQPHPCACTPTKPTAANAGLAPGTSAPIVHSAVPQVLSLQSRPR